MTGLNAHYLVLEDYPAGSDHGWTEQLCRGQTVYELTKADYGMAFHHTMRFGEPHVSVSLNPDGTYPLLTVPARVLRQARLP